MRDTYFHQWDGDLWKRGIGSMSPHPRITIAYVRRIPLAVPNESVRAILNSMKILRRPCPDLVVEYPELRYGATLR